MTFAARPKTRRGISARLVSHTAVDGRVTPAGTRPLPLQCRRRRFRDESMVVGKGFRFAVRTRHTFLIPLTFLDTRTSPFWSENKKIHMRTSESVFTFLATLRMRVNSCQGIQ